MLLLPHKKAPEPLPKQNVLFTPDESANRSSLLSYIRTQENTLSDPTPQPRQLRKSEAWILELLEGVKKTHTQNCCIISLICVFSCLYLYCCCSTLSPTQPKSHQMSHFMLIKSLADSIQAHWEKEEPCKILRASHKE